jgi:TonB-dependent receptor-like protein/carboxypeptidase-like protein
MKIPFSLAFLFISLLSYGQSTIKGRVLDSLSGEPLENAVIAAPATSTLSDQQGNFELRLRHNSDSLTISFVGYAKRHIAIKDPSQPLLIAMERGTIDLRSITVQPLPNNASFSTISHIDLHMHTINSAQDLMRLVPGLSLMQHQGGGLADHIFYRGFDADHGTDVGVSVDGMPLNLVSHTHGQGFSDLHMLIPELTTNLEYGKGPYYTDHGDFTTAGYLAFRTTDVLDKSTVRLEGGAFNSGRIMAAVDLLSKKAKRLGESAYIAAEGNYTDGPSDYPQHFNRANLFGKYITGLSPHTQLKVTLSAFNSLWRSSGEIPLRAVNEKLIGRWGYIDSAQGGNTTRTTGIIRLTTQLSDRLSIENQVYYSHYWFDLNYDETFFAEDTVNGDQLRQRETRDLYGYTGRLEQHTYLPDNHTLSSTAGWGFQLDDIHGSELSHTKDYNTVLDYLQHGNIREWTANAFLDEQYRTGKWLLDAGVRADYLNFYYADFLGPVQPAQGKAIVSPKFNAAYTFSNNLQAYIKLGKGFHSNDARVIAQKTTLDALPTAYGADLGINWKPLPSLYLNAALWYLSLDQELVYNGDDGTFSPGDKTKRQGIDLSARYELTRWLYADLDLVAVKARDAQAPKGEDYLPLSVPFYSSGGLYMKLPNGISGGWNARFMKDRPANEDNSLLAKGYFLNDLTVNYTRHRYELGLDIQNIFNTKWRDAQYEVTSRLRTEPQPVDDISFTPGMPFFTRVKLAVFF